MGSHVMQHIELESAVMLQSDQFVGLEQFEGGMNGGMFSVTNPFWPNAVLKKGFKHHIEEEAYMLQLVKHPNVVGVEGPG